jgi:hypothetical protein
MVWRHEITHALQPEKLSAPLRVTVHAADHYYKTKQATQIALVACFVDWCEREYAAPFL